MCTGTRTWRSPGIRCSTVVAHRQSSTSRQNHHHHPPPTTNPSKEPGEWQHGWQYWASSASDSTLRKSTMLSVQTAANRAHLRSHSGRNAGVVFAHAPTAPEFGVLPHLFRVLLLERMRLLLPITDSTCSGCFAPLDPRGLHRAACTRSGRLKKRATPMIDPSKCWPRPFHVSEDHSSRWM